jgi:hypothetical protein
MGSGSRFFLAILTGVSIALATLGASDAIFVLTGSGAQSVVASIVLLGAGWFAALAAYKWVKGDREWFSNLALTRAGAIENEEWDAEVAEGQIGVPRPCWRCGQLAPAEASQCPSCGASLE